MGVFPIRFKFSAKFKLGFFTLCVFIFFKQKHQALNVLSEIKPVFLKIKIALIFKGITLV